MILLLLTYIAYIAEKQETFSYRPCLDKAEISVTSDELNF